MAMTSFKAMMQSIKSLNYTSVSIITIIVSTLWLSLLILNVIEFRPASASSAAACTSWKTDVLCTADSKCIWQNITNIESGNYENTCICDSIPQDIVIVMDSSGSMEFAGWRIERQFVQKLLLEAISWDSHIGIVRFASYSTIMHYFTDTQDRESIVAEVGRYSFQRGWTHMKDAVEHALFLFRNQSTFTEKKMVFITDGNPIPAPQTPCGLSSDLLALGVRTIVIGVGTAWTRAKIECMVPQDAVSEDIVSVSEFSTEAFANITSKIHPWLCQPLSFLLTEVKPHLGYVADAVDPKIGYHPLAFVEFYNDIAGIDFNQGFNYTLAGNLVNGWIDPSSNVYAANTTDPLYWERGQYLVLFDDSAFLNTGEQLYPRCHQCVCDLLNTPSQEICAQSVYIGCHAGSACYFLDMTNETRVSVDDWRVIVYDDTDTGTGTGNATAVRRQIMNITFGMGVTAWPVIRPGFTLELSDKENCEPTNGQCWRESCYVFGTPGWDPILGCGCSEVNCRIFNDTNAVCLNDSCACSDWCYSFWGGASCYCIPPPTNCVVQLLNDPEQFSQPFGEGIWDRIDSYPYTVRYQFRWIDDSESNVQIAYTPNYQRYIIVSDVDHGYLSTWQQVRTLINFGDNPNTPNLTETEEAASEWTTCLVITMAPTESPTPPPTPALPPIEWCYITLLSQVGDDHILVNLNWSVADVSAVDTYNDNQFNDDYNIWVVDSNSDFAVISRLEYAGTAHDNQVITGQTNTDLIDNAVIEIRVGVRVHAVNQTEQFLTELYDKTLRQFSTLCELLTFAPSPAPTHNPTGDPTPQPSAPPTFVPTLPPTYACWEVSECVVQVTGTTADQNKDWLLQWLEDRHAVQESLHLPNSRLLFVYINGGFEFSILNSTSSPYAVVNKQIDPSADTIEIQVVQDLLPASEEDRFCPKMACVILTHNPSPAPTAPPTSAQPTASPSPWPTGQPSMDPTPAPTYNVPILFCQILYLSPSKYEVTFTVPEFDPPHTPTKQDSQYSIRYVNHDNNDQQAIAIVRDLSPSGTDIQQERLTAITISSNTSFHIRVVSYPDSVIYYGDETLCELLTLAPTEAPTYEPSTNPTPAPTFAAPATYVYDSSMCYRSPQRPRCKCNAEFFDYTCDGGDVASLSVTRTGSDAAPQDVADLNFIPAGYPWDLTLHWEIVSAFASQTEFTVDPAMGTITIPAYSEAGVTVLSTLGESPTAQTLTYILRITGCASNNSVHACTPIYPAQVNVVLSPPLTLSSAIIGGDNAVPDWVWYMLLGGIVAAMVGGWLFYLRGKNKNMAKEAAGQNAETSALVQGFGVQDATGVQNQTQINPLNPGI